MALPPHLQELAARVSNWGRWGPDDRRGTLNLIDDAAVKRGLGAARQGRPFSLSLAFDEDGPQAGFIPGRINPTRTMLCINASMTGDPSDFCTSDDAVSMGVQASTHWDSLAHGSYDNLLYNGVPASTIDEAGSHEHGIETFGPIVTRGVLLDLARLKGIDYFEEGYALTGEDLDGCVAAAGVTIEPGDVICLRTGHQHWFRQGDRMTYAAKCPGPSTKSIEWFRDHDVAAVATDTITFEVFPPEDPNHWLPVHMIHLRDMGLVQGQNWNLDPIAADCAADGQYDFLLSATPLPMTRALGGAVAPTAIK
jgi:kynurenine formamidase